MAAKRDTIRRTSWPLFLTAAFFASGYAQDELARRATWQQPSVAEVKAQVDQCLAQRQLDGPTQAKIDALWRQTASAPSPSLLEAVATTLQLADDASRPVVTFCRGSRSSVTLPDFDVLKDDQQSEFIRYNLRLLYGRWLTDQRLYNEAADQLQSLQPQDVVDPALLLFFQSAVQHRLLQKEEALATIARLLENEESIPQRYTTVARLMEADLRPLEADSLNEITRLMDSIHVRLGHGRAGRRVRKEEDDVVAKLDKLIKKLEEQAKKSKGSGGATGTLQPSNPMQDSSPGGGTGPGNVDPKRFAEKEDWGNLPPKERQEALQQLGKEYPSYYREVIEEYFRKLARDDSSGQP